MTPSGGPAAGIAGSWCLYAQDGKLKYCYNLQHESPGPEKESNWLPAPDGPFALALRIYWSDRDILEGKWMPAAVRKAS